MIKMAKTIGFGATLVSAALLIHYWCQLVHVRFNVEHPGGQGAAISNLYWNFSWIGIAVGGALAGLLVVSHAKRLERLYEATYYFGWWLLVVWFGAALLAMEVSFIPWFDPRGDHY